MASTAVEIPSSGVGWGYLSGESQCGNVNHSGHTRRSSRLFARSWDSDNSLFRQFRAPPYRIEQRPLLFGAVRRLMSVWMITQIHIYTRPGKRERRHKHKNEAKITVTRIYDLNPNAAALRRVWIKSRRKRVMGISTNK